MEWYRRGIQLSFRIEPAGFALAAAYALLCWAARQVSMDQFYLPAGIRVAALLLFPPRMWPYLFLGEYAYFAHMRVPMIERYGVAWVILSSAFLMPAVALIVRWHRRMMAARTDAWFISAAITCAATATLLNLCFSHLFWPVPHHNDFLTDAARGAMGQFAGILTVVPVALLWIRRSSGWQWTRRYRIATVCCVLAIGGIGLFALQAPADASFFKTSLQVSTAIPAIALTCMHGWRGAAIGVPLLNLAIGMSSKGGEPWAFDSSTFVAQQTLLVSGVALLALGYSISHYYVQCISGRQRELLSMAHARASHIGSEMSLRQRVLDMRTMGEGIDHSLSEIAYYLRENGHAVLSRSLLQVSVANSRKFREQTSLVYPTCLEHVGLYLSVQLSGLGEVWTRSRRVLSPRMAGDPCALSNGLQLAAYRLLADAVSLLLQREKGQVRVQARCGRVGESTGIVLVVALIDVDQRISEATMEMVIEQLTGRTLAYGGTVQCRRNRIRMLLLDSNNAARAWVA